MLLSRLIKLHIFFMMIYSFSLNVEAQKYHFQHYDIGDGLMQSQVTSICQDNHNQIWLTTMGGINCFDSRQFSSFTIEDGLPMNSSFSITKDKQGKIWAGGSEGLTQFGAYGLKNIAFPLMKTRHIARNLLSDSSNNIWTVFGKNLYKRVNGQLQVQVVVADDEWVSVVHINNKGVVFAAVAKKGIYKLEKNRWKLYASLDEKSGISYVMDFVFDKQNPDRLYFITDTRLYSLDKDTIKAESPKLFEPLHTIFTCLLLDNEKGLWIGTDNGAYLLKNGTLTYFSDKNGFTNLRVFCIFQDADNQIWFGTDGAGLFKYQNNAFLIFDKTQGLDNDVVMTMTKGFNNEIYIGSNGGKLLRYRNHQIEDLKLPRSKMMSSRVNYLFSDYQNNLWIGTDNSGLWLRKGDQYSKIYPPKEDSHYAMFTAIKEDNTHNLWFASGNGCFYLQNNQLVKVKDFNDYCSSMIEIGQDSILVGTSDGVKLIRNKMIDPNFSAILPNEQINCLEYRKPFLIAATNEKGVYVYNLKTRELQKISTKNGLNSNIIYSVLLVNDQLWIGTVRGVSKYILTIKGNDLNLKPIEETSLPFECNENAILKLNNEVWVGTIHGIIVYPIYNNTDSNTSAKIVIENIQTYTSSKKLKYSYFSGYKLPDSLSIPSNESHIAIKFQAVQFGASKVLYQYMLEGLDDDYSKPGQNSFVDYPQLPPGNYTFKVRPVIANLPGNAALYQFTVAPQFYQTLPFKIMAALLFLAILISIPIYKNYLNQRKLNFIHQLRLQEQENVRRQTGEDFHDDLGNKLTRINMLSELLDKKMPAGLEEQKKLTQQIRSSAIEMYNGTKGILWALNPQNDHLIAVLNEVEKFGHTLFENMNIVFNAVPHMTQKTDIKLPLGYSHNITLIFKELMNNILKHSDANIVTFSYEMMSYSRICLQISDNGKGFKTDEFYEGNGLKNIQNRAQKLNGEITIYSRPGEGTVTRLVINVIT